MCTRSQLLQGPDPKLRDLYHPLELGLSTSIGVGDRTHDLRLVLQASTLQLSHLPGPRLVFRYDNLAGQQPWLHDADGKQAEKPSVSEIQSQC